MKQTFFAVILVICLCLPLFVACENGTQETRAESDIVTESESKTMETETQTKETEMTETETETTEPETETTETETETTETETETTETETETTETETETTETEPETTETETETTGTETETTETETETTETEIETTETETEDVVEVTYSEGLKFKSNGDGTCYVSGSGSCKDTDISVPTVSPAGDRVTGIGKSAFYGCSTLVNNNVPNGLGWLPTGNYINLESMIIPDSVISISDRAFEDCSSLTTIVISSSVTSIGRAAFDGCSSLTVVYYTGTEAEWAAINIDSDNSALTSASIHFNYNP